MQVIAEEKKVVVANAKTECEELLVTIVADKRVADDQEKQVSAEAAKIGRDAEEANAIAAECQAGLDQAMPALEAAQAALNVLTKKDMSELKAYSKPPAMVELCLKGVMTVLKKSPTWDAAKKSLGDSNFLANLINFDKDRLDDALLNKMKKYINDPDYTPEKIGRLRAAKGLCQWVHAMFIYGNVAKRWRRNAPNSRRRRTPSRRNRRRSRRRRVGSKRCSIRCRRSRISTRRPQRTNRRSRTSSRIWSKNSAARGEARQRSRGREGSMGTVHRDVRGTDRSAPG